MQADENVKRNVWVVYPDSIRMGLSDENKPAAWFLYSDHAYNWAKSMWGKFYIVEAAEPIVIGRSEQVCGCGNELTEKEVFYETCLKCGWVF